MIQQKVFLIIYCLSQLGAGQQLFKKLNHFPLLRYFYYWRQFTYDFHGIKYLNDTNLRWTPEAVYFQEEELEDRDIFFKQYNNVPYGLDAGQNKTFFGVPRTQYGIPSTLNYYLHVKRNDTKGGAQYNLKPYPNVESIPSFVSVYRPKVDFCKRLWVVDTGLLEYPGQHEQVKPPEIIVFNIVTDKEILRYQLKPTDLSNGITSGLTSITVDVTRTTCADAYAYINDLATGGLIVFSLKDKDSWRFEHPTFNYDAAASFVYNGNIIDWKEGIFSIALSDPDAAGVRTAYYHPFLSTQEFSITTDVLKDKNGDIEKNFKLVGNRGPYSQSGIHVYHSPTRTLLFANIARSGVMCWNIDKPLNPKNTALVAQHAWWLRFITDMRVFGDLLWLFTNNLDVYTYSSVNTTFVNFLLYYGRVKDLIKGTVCDGSKT